MRGYQGKRKADKIAEKFISSLEMFVWCERPCRNSTSHERLVWEIDDFLAERFPENLGSFGQVKWIRSMFVKIYFKYKNVRKR